MLSKFTHARIGICACVVTEEEESLKKRMAEGRSVVSFTAIFFGSQISGVCAKGCWQ